MKNVILLSGSPNSGKSSSLRYYLPKALGQNLGKRKFWYKKKLVWIILRSLHESYNWIDVLKKINSTQYDIIILPVWSNDCIKKSSFTNKPAIELLESYLSNFNLAGTVFTQVKNNKSEQGDDQKRCSNEIFKIIERLV